MDRQTILKSTPTVVGGGCVAGLGLCATLWPEQTRLWIEWMLSPDQVYWFGLGLLALVALYVFALVGGKKSEGPSKRIPLYLAARWIVQDSQWAADFEPEHDDQWVSLVDDELTNALSTGQIRSWGYYKPHGQEAEAALSEIPPEFWRRANWNSNELATETPPTHIWRYSQDGGGQYRRVQLDEKEVKGLWPRRSRRDAVKGRSPTDRISKSAGGAGYQAKWDQQDECYRRMKANPAYGVFASVFEPEHPSRIEEDER